MSVRLLPYDNGDPITYMPLTFPGGEPHCTVGGVKNRMVIIDCRCHGMTDFGHILVATDALWRDGARELALFLPYFPGARQDRVTSPGTPKTLTIFAAILNRQGYAGIFVVDPHSKELEESLRNFHDLEQPLPPGVPEYAGVIAPDAGARFRANHMAVRLGVELFIGSKTRDPATGKIVGYEKLKIPPGHYLVVDDICDGGATFLALANAIDNRHADTTLDLYVTHGIFSKGINPLLAHYNHIYTTDSWTTRDRLMTENNTPSRERVTIIGLWNTYSSHISSALNERHRNVGNELKLGRERQDYLMNTVGYDASRGLPQRAPKSKQRRYK